MILRKLIWEFVLAAWKSCFIAQLNGTFSLNVFKLAKSTKHRTTIVVEK